MGYFKKLLSCFGSGSSRHSSTNVEKAAEASIIQASGANAAKAEEKVSLSSSTPGVPPTNDKDYPPSKPLVADILDLSLIWLAEERLNLQYFLWKNLLQFNLHPDIPQPAPSARIADVATGTGLWLVDLAAALPSSVRFDGFDISLEQAPAASFLPANVHMHHWNMFDEPPQEFVGQFDIVHVRLVTLVIKNNDPVRLIENLRKLLKPGGYLQWDEVDAIGSYIRAADSGMATPALEALFKTFKIPKSSRGRDE
ncbi:hypothetical protein MMC27_001876 [Xylographa pallens]|nr:hypothetical protein [Xylographa pallens]